MAWRASSPQSRSSRSPRSPCIAAVAASDAPPVIRSTIAAPDCLTTGFAQLRVVAAGDASRVPSAQGRLAVRRLSEGSATAAAREAKAASNPFFSLDGEWLGVLRRRKVEEGARCRAAPPQVLADAPSGRGGSWARGRHDRVRAGLRMADCRRCPPMADSVDHADDRDDRSNARIAGRTLLPDGQNLCCSRSNSLGKIFDDAHDRRGADRWRRAARRVRWRRRRAVRRVRPSDLCQGRQLARDRVRSGRASAPAARRSP